MLRAIVIFAHQANLEPKRFGLGPRADRRLAQFLIDRTIATAKSCDDLADIVLADESLQTGDTFEERLLGALDDVEARGYERVVIVGSDTFDLDASDLRRALLEDGPVLGPSTDGGFYLFGTDTSSLGVLRGLRWRSSAIGAQLTARLDDPVLLATRDDVDGAVDVRRSIARLRLLYRELLGVSLDNSMPDVATAAPASLGALRAAHIGGESPRGPPTVAV